MSKVLGGSGVHDAILNRVVFRKTKAFDDTLRRLKRLGLSEEEALKVFTEASAKEEAVPVKESFMSSLKKKIGLS